jgi:arginyl-tRNA synthetase
MRYLKNKIKNVLEPFILDEFGEKTDIRFLNPPKPEMGDLTVSSAFEIGKKLRKNPREIASSFVSILKAMNEIERIDIAGPGYLNIFFNKKIFLSEIEKIFELRRDKTEFKKVIVEHTNINPNKAAHIGHLRNAILGDTLSRMLKERGEIVEVQNYIDDTGVQVADVVYGVLHIDKLSIDDLKKMDKMDFYLWELYVKVHLQDDEETKKIRREVHHKIEQGISPEKDYAEVISLGVLKRHLETVKRLGIDYDVLPRESDIINLKFWQNAFDILKDKKVIRYQNEGANKGCWVMDVFEDGEDREKIIVKSNGAITYVGKDISYHLWKFGLLNKDFYYKKMDEKHYISISEPAQSSGNISFGSGDRVYNVIDQRQSYLQNIVKKALEKLGYEKEAENLIHFSYEVVALSKKSAEDLGFNIPPDKKIVEVSGRKGIGVKADDLIDELERRAKGEIKKRHPDFPEEKIVKISKKIGSGALRYYMLKYTLNAIIVFDFDEALKFEGETGPYLQYSNVRMKSLFKKYEDRFGEKVGNSIRDIPDFSILSEEEKNKLWETIVFASRLDSELELSINNLEPSKLAKYGFSLCQKFNYIYNSFSVINEEDKDKRKLRLITIYIIYRQLNKILDILGIEKPDIM